MKKIAVAVAVASALGASSVGVQAYTMGTFDFGLLVPFAQSVSQINGTYVGLISRCGGKVYWSAWDVDSKHQEDDVIPVTPLDMVSFDVGNEIAANQARYILFEMDRNSGATATPPNTPDGNYDTYDDGCLAGNAFWVNLGLSDVTYVPVFPVDITDIVDGVNPVPVGLQKYPDYISSLASGAQLNEWIFARYFQNNVPNDADKTEIYLWSVCRPPESVFVRAYDDTQDWTSGNIEIPEDELNIIDPEPWMSTLNKAFTDGFITIPVLAAGNPNAPASGDEDNLRYCDVNGQVGPGLPANLQTAVNDAQAMVSWSQVYATVFGASQTLLNAHACYAAGVRPWDAGAAILNTPCPITRAP
jgi:hypothetical protein